MKSLIPALSALLLVPSYSLAASVDPVAVSRSVTVPAVSGATSNMVQRYSRVRPNFITNLAAMRMVNLTLGQGNVAKGTDMRAFLGTLMQRRTVAAMSQGKPTQYTAVQDAEGFEYILSPVAYATPAILRPMDRIRYDNHGMRFLNKPSHELQVDNLTFREGEALITTKRPMTVDCGLVKVGLAKRVDVIINRRPGIVQIANLNDHCRDAVEVEFENRHLFLKPGEQCCVAQEESTLLYAHCGDGCGRREKRTLHSGSLSACVCEVSLASLLQNYPITHQLYISKHPDDKQTASKVLRMAACIAFARSKAKYQWVD